MQQAGLEDDPLYCETLRKLLIAKDRRELQIKLTIQLQDRREIYEIGMAAASTKKQWTWHLRCNKMTDGSPLIVRCIVEHGSATNYKWRKQVLP